MKLYEVTSINIRNNGEYGDEDQSYLGTDFKEAQKAYQEKCSDFKNYLTNTEKKSTIVEARVYDIDDTVDVSDEDELINAMYDCVGYDLFEKPKMYQI